VRSLLPAALALALLGCPRAPPPDLSADPAELLAAVRAHQGKATRVRGSARLTVDAPGARGTMDALAAAEAPDRLRIEVLDFFGAPAAALVAGGGRFVFFDARRGTWYRGPATPENVSLFLPVALPPEELCAVLLGAAPLLPGKALSAAPGKGVMHLALGEGELVQRLEVGAEAAVEASRVRRRTAAGEEPHGYDLAFSLFRHRAGTRFPGETRLDARAAGARLGLAWGEDVVVNGPPEPALFRLDPPPGARVVELPPGTAPPPVELPLSRAE
jgi:hypothetical protein